MENKFYKNINELIEEINSLGDWKEPSQRENYLKVVSKIIALYHGYEITDEKDNKTLKNYPNEVIEAVTEVCREKIPNESQVYIDEENLRPGCPEYAKYLTYLDTPQRVSLLGERTEIDIIAKNEFDIDVHHTSVTQEEANELIASCKAYLEKTNDKSNIPYYKTMRQVIMNTTGVSEQEADRRIETQGLSKLDFEFETKEKMEKTIEEVGKVLNIPQENMADLSNFVYKGEKGKIVDSIKGNSGVEQNLQTKSSNELIMDALFAIHDREVRENSRESSYRLYEYKQMPSELLGWENTKQNLLYVGTIFETAGIEIDEAKLEQVYNDRVKEFFLDKKIETAEDLVEGIAHDRNFYPALEGQAWNNLSMYNDEYVERKIIPWIERDGIGNIEETRKNIVSQIMKNPKSEDIDRLSEDEKKMMNKSYEKDDEIQAKQSIIKNIFNLIKIRKKNKELIEEQLRNQKAQEQDNSRGD